MEQVSACLRSIVLLTSLYWRSRVEEGMVIMPLKRFGDSDSDSIIRKNKLLKQFAYVLKYFVSRLRIAKSVWAMGQHWVN